MNSLAMRGWILLMAATAFTAGVAIGRWSGAREATSPGPYALYAGMLEQEFELSPRRAAHLRWLLADHAREVTALEAEFIGGSRAELREQLGARDAQLAALIRDKVLPPKAHARYDQMLVSGPTTATSR